MKQPRGKQSYTPDRKYLGSVPFRCDTTELASEFNNCQLTPTELFPQMTSSLDNYTGKIQNHIFNGSGNHNDLSENITNL